MFGKRRPVVTEQHSQKIERLRQSLEVLYGERATLVHIDFNTLRARFRLTTEVVNLSFPDFGPETVCIHFAAISAVEAGLKYEPFVARFDFEPGEVRVMNRNSPVQRGVNRHTMWWAGRSYTDRRLEPLDPNAVEYCAWSAGLTVEEYLNK